MNAYRFNIGNFLKETIMLSSHIETGFYVRLLCAYYVQEKPLPLDKEQCYGIVQARTPEEKLALDRVLEICFSLEADGYHHVGADKTIARSMARKARRKEAIHPPPVKEELPSVEPAIENHLLLSTGEDVVEENISIPFESMPKDLIEAQTLASIREIPETPVLYNVSLESQDIGKSSSEETFLIRSDLENIGISDIEEDNSLFNQLIASGIKREDFFLTASSMARVNRLDGKNTPAFQEILEKLTPDFLKDKQIEKYVMPRTSSMNVGYEAIPF